ncbi:MAG: flagellar motor switch protein FliM [Alphaproteobacteria bacterium]|nr:MAG: flagellar motor switch protein FliM [Alphaproteobacteria bacterium]TAF15422.1 MAG: flagellar motor switch protein FliM [Alphaproteobacteria bacterium]TAF39370.1 MAG: flagellar motor switch protein FliM [Alphaproteobacteria bacterium]TAF75680.1 MAG: flagellar motor switch protein FliM [Alphaproteobacteria bacterium]
MVDQDSDNIDDEDAASAWDAMLSGDTETEERVLNQDEIDLLLGFDTKSAEEVPISGLLSIMGKSRMAYEKLPMLEVVFDRLVRTLSTSLRNFTGENVDISIDTMVSMRFDEYLNTIPLPALLVVHRAVEWENFGLVMVDSSLIYTMVDVLLGGRKATKKVRVEGRPYTTIEQDLVKSLVETVLTDMSQSFDPVSPINFQFDRLETNPRFATITRPNNAVLLVRFQVTIDERNGMIELLFPHETLEPIRELLSQIFIGEKFGQDSAWERHMGNEIRHSHVAVRALLDEKEVSLGDLVRLKVGTTLLLDKDPQDDVLVKCGDVILGKGRLGRVGEKMAISLLEPIAKRLERERDL